jgi:hypothetical protein
MKLPNGENAYIPLAKLTSYLLSHSHPLGRHKALIFNNLGYDISNPAELESGLLNIVRHWDVIETMTSDWGAKYIIDGVLFTPIGSEFPVRTVWITDVGESRPRFVTAYPFQACHGEIIMVQELDIVVLTSDLTDHGLKAGDVGAVVHCYPENDAFEVEFVTGKGQAAALLTLTKADIRPMGEREILHAREITSA